MLNSIFKKDLSRTDFDVDGEFVTINQDTLTQKLEILVPSETTIKRLAAEVHDDKETPHRTDAEIKALALEVHKDAANDIIQTLLDAGALKAHPTTDGGTVWGFNGEHALLKDIDTTAPVITMTTNAVTLAVGEAFIPLDYVTSIIDNVDGTLTPLDALTVKPATVDTSVIGDQTITYTVKDKEGNSSTATLILTIASASTVVPAVIGFGQGDAVTGIIDTTINNANSGAATLTPVDASFNLFTTKEGATLELWHNETMLESFDTSLHLSNSVRVYAMTTTHNINWAAGDTLSIRGDYEGLVAANSMTWNMA